MTIEDTAALGDGAQIARGDEAGAAG